MWEGVLEEKLLLQGPRLLLPLPWGLPGWATCFSLSPLGWGSGCSREERLRSCTPEAGQGAQLPVAAQAWCRGRKCADSGLCCC